jgi:hypothetical protein
MSWIRATWAIWDRIWFGRTSRYQLGIFRAILLIALSRTWLAPAAVARVLNGRWPASLLYENLALRITGLPVPLPQPWLGWVPTIMEVALWMGVVGLLTRPSLLVLAFLNLYVQGLRNGFGFFNHSLSLGSIFLVILAVSPGVGAWSVDSLVTWGWRRWRNSGEAESAPTGLISSLAGGPVPVWGARLMLVTLCLGYGTAGVAKLRWGGVGWLDGATLSFYLSGKSRMGSQQFLAADPDEEVPRWKDGVGLVAYLYGTGGSKTGRWLAKRRPAAIAMSIAALVFELGFVIALFGNRWLILCLVAGIGFHLGTNELMHIYFKTWMWCYTAFIDWRWPVAAYRRLRRPACPS